MRVEEIRFWRKTVEDGGLLEALRADSARAVLFFGEAAVLKENEAELYKTLEAYEIITSSEKELLDDLNRVPDSMLEDLSQFTPQEQLKIKRLSRFTAEHVLAAKNLAHEHLRRVFQQ